MNITMLSIGTHTISMAMFNSKLFEYKRVYIWLSVWIGNSIVPCQGNNPSWQTHFFQRGSCTTNQIWYLKFRFLKWPLNGSCYHYISPFCCPPNVWWKKSKPGVIRALWGCHMSCMSAVIYGIGFLQCCHPSHIGNLNMMGINISI